MRKRRGMRMACLLFVALSAWACAATKPYISNDTRSTLDTKPTSRHRFSYVRLYEENGDWVLYGKVEHRHDLGETEPHVDLVVTDASRKVIRQASLLLADRTGKRRGWNGAAFRMRLPGFSEADARVGLAFHETECPRETSFDCGDNAAKAGLDVNTEAER